MATYVTSEAVRVGDLVFPAFKYEAGMQHLPSGNVSAVSHGHNRYGRKLIILDLEDGRTYIYRPDEKILCERATPDTPHP